MKTLSDDITLQIETTGIPEGYVSTKIYADGIGVFSGLAYIPGDNSSLAININDIASQNRGKYDYLKLTDDGVVTTTPLIDGIYGPISYQYRFKCGQIYRYVVNIVKDSSYYNQYVDVLTGYDYPNKDLKPQYMDPSISSLCRIMQGCDWVYDHDEGIGNFQNLLLPHYPYVATNKYGMGLQLWADSASNFLISYDLECEVSNDVSLGSLVFGSSNSTFITLNDLITTFNMGNIDKDTSIYLKKHGVSGDEFGDYEEDDIYYTGDVSILQMVECSREIGSADEWQERSINRSDENFPAALRKYIELAQDGGLPESQYNNVDEWNANEIINNPATLVFHTSNNQSEYLAETAVENYTDFYFNNPIIYKTDDFFEYAYRPGFYADIYETEIPAKYIGKCPVAIFDKCYSRYYLAWMDRYGDVQSLAFDGKPEYTEKIGNSEIQDYKLRRRIIQKQIQPVWKLNTKWLSEDVYPMYEAIYTSPYLLLYDTQTNRSWNVILTDTNYKEKTYKTEKSLFNLLITLEANKKLNYIF